MSDKIAQDEQLSDENLESVAGGFAKAPPSVFDPNGGGGCTGDPIILFEPGPEIILVEG